MKNEKLDGSAWVWAQERVGAVDLEERQVEQEASWVED